MSVAVQRVSYSSNRTSGEALTNASQRGEREDDNHEEPENRLVVLVLTVGEDQRNDDVQNGQLESGRGETVAGRRRGSGSEALESVQHMAADAGHREPESEQKRRLEVVDGLTVAEDL